MGAEHKGKGVNIALGPMMNMGYDSFHPLRNICRLNQHISVVLHKEDGTGKVSVLTPSSPEKLRTRPFLACNPLVFKLVRSILSTSTLQCCFQCIMSDLKYSEQEHKRTQESSNVDDRTQHEIYAHPFLRSVQAGVASVMCSYSKSHAFDVALR